VKTKLKILHNRKNRKKVRLLKVVSKSQPRAYFQWISVPEIRLMGKWLGELGFEQGKYAKIQMMDKKIIITLKEEKKADNNV